ncbi:zinc ribbon domain-containing protein, partial [[Eubacterium] cellulosolvens]
TIGYSYRNVKVYEYYLTVTSSQEKATVSGGGWYREGASATVSTPSTIEEESNIQYVFSGWGGDYAGQSPTVSITMDKPKNLIANYKAQYQISVKSIPMEAFGLLEEGWIDQGTVKTLPTAPDIVKAEQGKRYVFEGWFIDGVRSAGNPISLTIDKPFLVEARYKTQYLLTVDSLYGYPTGEGWYDEDSTVSFSVTSPVPAGFGRKWVFEQWRGDALTAQLEGSVIMDSPKSVTAEWRLDSTTLYITYSILIVAIVAVIVGLVLIVTRYPTMTKTGNASVCQNCGYRLGKGFYFCPICGTQREPLQQTRKTRA